MNKGDRQRAADIPRLTGGERILGFGGKPGALQRGFEVRQRGQRHFHIQRGGHIGKQSVINNPASVRRDTITDQRQRLVALDFRNNAQPEKLHLEFLMENPDFQGEAYTWFHRMRRAIAAGLGKNPLSLIRLYYYY